MLSTYLPYATSLSAQPSSQRFSQWCKNALVKAGPKVESTVTPSIYSYKRFSKAKDDSGVAKDDSLIASGDKIITKMRVPIGKILLNPSSEILV